MFRVRVRIRVRVRVRVVVRGFIEAAAVYHLHGVHFTLRRVGE